MARRWYFKWISHNPYFCKHRSIVVVSRRRTRGPDDLYWDVIFDPVLQLLNRNDYLYLDFRDEPACFDFPIKTNSIGASAPLNYAKKRVKANVSTNLWQDEIDFCRHIERLVNQTFDLTLNVEPILSKALINREVVRTAYAGLFRRLRARYLFIASAYTRKPVVEAAHDHRMTVMEFQHGAIDDTHLGYHYPEGVFTATFPDYFLSFGPYWRTNCNMPLSQDRLHDIGYLYRDIISTSSPGVTEEVGKQKRICFISQAKYANVLKSFAYRLHKELDASFQISYKLHPREQDDETFENTCKFFSGTRVQVIGASGPSLYDLQRRSEWQVGIDSTALYEGMSLGCRTVLLDAYGAAVRNLVTRGWAVLQSPQGELVSLDTVPDPPKEMFFSQTSRQIIHSKLSELGLAPYLK